MYISMEKSACEADQATKAGRCGSDVGAQGRARGQGNGGGEDRTSTSAREELHK
jgi:hypothetical protein